MDNSREQAVSDVAERVASGKLSQKRAASLFGISRTTLQRRLQGIQPRSIAQTEVNTCARYRNQFSWIGTLIEFNQDSQHLAIKPSSWLAKLHVNPGKMPWIQHIAGGHGLRSGTGFPQSEQGH